MPETEDVDVVAMRSVRSVHLIDGGDTVAVRMETAGGGETCVLLPTGAVGDLLFLLAEAVTAAPGGGPLPGGPRTIRGGWALPDS